MVLYSVSSFFHCYPVINRSLPIHFHWFPEGEPTGTREDWIPFLAVQWTQCRTQGMPKNTSFHCWEALWGLQLKSATGKVWGDYCFLQVEIFLLFKFHLPFPQNICRGDRNRVWKKRERDWILLLHEGWFGNEQKSLSLSEYPQIVMANPMLLQTCHLRMMLGDVASMYLPVLKNLLFSLFIASCWRIKRVIIINNDNNKIMIKSFPVSYL